MKTGATNGVKWLKDYWSPESTIFSHKKGAEGSKKVTNGQKKEANGCKKKGAMAMHSNSFPLIFGHGEAYG